MMSIPKVMVGGVDEVQVVKLKLKIKWLKSRVIIFCYVQGINPVSINALSDNSIEI